MQVNSAFLHSQNTLGLGESDMTMISREKYAYL